MATNSHRSRRRRNTASFYQKRLLWELIRSCLLTQETAGMGLIPPSEHPMENIDGTVLPEVDRRAVGYVQSLYRRANNADYPTLEVSSDGVNDGADPPIPMFKRAALDSASGSRVYIPSKSIYRPHRHKSKIPTLSLSQKPGYGGYVPPDILSANLMTMFKRTPPPRALCLRDSIPHAEQILAKKEDPWEGDLTGNYVKRGAVGIKEADTYGHVYSNGLQKLLNAYGRKKVDNLVNAMEKLGIMKRGYSNALDDNLTMMMKRNTKLSAVSDLLMTKKDGSLAAVADLLMMKRDPLNIHEKRGFYTKMYNKRGFYTKMYNKRGFYAPQSAYAKRGFYAPQSAYRGKRTFYVPVGIKAIHNPRDMMEMTKRSVHEGRSLMDQFAARLKARHADQKRFSDLFANRVSDHDATKRYFDYSNERPMEKKAYPQWGRGFQPIYMMPPKEKGEAAYSNYMKLQKKFYPSWAEPTTVQSVYMPKPGSYGAAQRFNGVLSKGARLPPAIRTKRSDSMEQEILGLENSINDRLAELKGVQFYLQKKKLLLQKVVKLFNLDPSQGAGLFRRSASDFPEINGGAHIRSSGASVGSPM